MIDLIGIMLKKIPRWFWIIACGFICEDTSDTTFWLQLFCISTAIDVLYILLLLTFES